MGNDYRPAIRGQPHQPSMVVWNSMLRSIDKSRHAAVSGGPVPVPRLPAVEGVLAPSSPGFRPVVAGEAVRLVSSGTGENAFGATVPLGDMLSASPTERLLTGAYRARYSLLDPTAAGASLEDPVAICIEARNRLFALSGLAWCRVRALRGWHRFARRCIPQPGDGPEELAASVGCLDSCGWGPAEILGWVQEGFNPLQPYQGLASTQLAYLSEPGRIGWALVRL